MLNDQLSRIKRKVKELQDRLADEEIIHNKLNPTESSEHAQERAIKMTERLGKAYALKTEAIELTTTDDKTSCADLDPTTRLEEIIRLLNDEIGQAQRRASEKQKLLIRFQRAPKTAQLTSAPSRLETTDTELTSMLAEFAALPKPKSTN